MLNGIVIFALAWVLSATFERRRGPVATVRLHEASLLERIESLNEHIKALDEQIAMEQAYNRNTKHVPQ